MMRVCFVAALFIPPSPRYFHRLLNPKKLINIGFTRLAPRMNMARTIKLYKLPDQTTTGGCAITLGDQAPLSERQPPTLCPPVLT